MTTAQKAPAKAPAYENNPFFVAINGLELLFKKAQAIGIVFAVFAALSLFSSLPSAFVPADNQPAMTPEQSAKADQQFADGLAAVPIEVWILVGIIILVVLLIAICFGLVISGVSDYTSAQLSRGKEASFSEAFKAVFSNFWGYLWVHIVVGFKVFLWSLLLIIPGIVMAIRYSLAGVAFFDKKMKGNAAVKESSRLTKGAWLTTFASQSLFNVITFGVIAQLLIPGTNAVLYRQLRDYDEHHLAKPKAHVLSWLTVIIPPLFFITIVFIIVAFTALLVVGSNPQ